MDPNSLWSHGCALDLRVVVYFRPSLALWPAPPTDYSPDLDPLSAPCPEGARDMLGDPEKHWLEQIPSVLRLIRRRIISDQDISWIISTVRRIHWYEQSSTLVKRWGRFLTSNVERQNILCHDRISFLLRTALEIDDCLSDGYHELISETQKSVRLSRLIGGGF